MRVRFFGSVVVLLLLVISGAAQTPQQSGNPSTSTTGTGLIAGQVIEATSRRPVASAVVTLALAAAPAPAAASAPSAPTIARRAVAVTNAEGRFVFRDLPGGSYTLLSAVDGFASGASGRRRPNGPSRAIVLAGGARVTDAVISMWRLGSISGTVRDDRGEPVIGASVWGMRQALVNGIAQLGLQGGTVESTDDRGQYRLSGLMPGSYAITVRTPMQSASVATVDEYQASITSGTTAAIRGNWMSSGAVQIERAGLLVGDWQVSVSLGGLAPLPGPNGTILIHPWLYYPNASSPNDATLIALEAGQSRSGIDLTLPLVSGVRVSGVLTAPDGPARGHGVRLRPVPTGGLIEDIPVGYSISDSAGRFAFHGVTPGNYIVEAYRVPAGGPMPPPPPAAGGVAASRPEAVASPVVTPLFADARVTVGASHVDGLTLSLQPGARLSGRVVFDGANQPPPARISSMTVTLQPLTGSVRAIPMRVYPDGGFTTSGYPPGRYLVVASSPGPEWTLASVRIGSEDAVDNAFTLGTTDIADVVLTFTDRLTSLSGTVRVEPSGDPESTVVAYPADVDAWLASGMSARRLAVADVSQTGAYDLRFQLPGDYMVVVVPPEIAPDVDREFIRRFGPGAVRVSLAPGEKKTQPLILRPLR